MSWLLIPWLAFCDRLGGGGFGWLGAKGWLATGHKWVRRYLLPATIWWLNQTWEQAFLCVLMAIILSTDLDEIEQRQWDTVAMFGISLAYVLYPLAGLLGLAVPAWWLLGIYLSNIGLNQWKLGWHWVELIRGGLIGLVIVL